MYSPKIKEELIPKLYIEAKAKKIRMTTLVNRVLEKALDGGDRAITEGPAGNNGGLHPSKIEDESL
jgi:hypothetical protein